MKNQFPKSGALVILFLFTLAFTVNSCKKDVAVSQTTPLTQKQQIDVVNEAKPGFKETKLSISHRLPLMMQAVPASGTMA